MNRLLFLSVILFCSFFGNAQTQLVAYSKDFEFKEGIYIDSRDFLENKPVPKTKIISDMNHEDFDFMHQVTSQKSIEYLDASGIKQTIESNKLFGYSKNNGVYIYHGNDFYRISLIGTLCHYTATVITYSPGMGMGFGYGGMGTTSTVTRELRQFIFDTRAGKVVDFTVDNMEYILESDPELHTAFMALKKRKKRDAVFLYLRKYNQRHPLYFPAY